MNILFVLLAIASSPAPITDESRLTQDVDAFVIERQACDHFREEPTEGSSPDQIERREFVRDSFDIYCAGTDRRLAALKHRFKDNPAVMARLSGYETSVEGVACVSP